MRIETSGSHARMVFDSLTDYIDHNTKRDYRSADMASRGKDFFGGAQNLSHALEMARTGLQREGIEAMAIAAGQLKDIESQLNYQAFSSEWHVSGTDVDVALYLAGEPECMIDYRMEDMERPERVVTLVIGTNVPWHVSAKAIKLRGQKIVALIEAIEATGSTTEIWADRTSNAMGGSKTSRTSVRIKAPGDFYDSGSVMFAFTHAAFNRVLSWNADHSLPKEWHDAVGVGSFYGNNGKGHRWHPDYPEGSTIIPPLKDDNDTFSVTDTLRKLKLLKD
ncbi:MULTISPECIES: DUF7192 family protein [Mycobacteroides]|uniref:DUF7192 family protein n=1 Tax=Mycobacteroides TaxID=670516 RepID=UPI00092CBDBD|nr:hypothetical protein [Mycobacteroides abscessus]SHT26298.1 Uncharacterised protein [Mycobacteroides abscessus subsp. abscessus]SHW69641.1 Uncharacterised protein [Mycobacteroides abscessus subsp. abscessus]SHY71778.1 Uncharacterised protein [Mycobacteroides abscessus subsp. abscessus]SHZ43041.1 Uncharacterised protein [Mycobacteroides abscessus subsp. abscessus]SKR90645.1 Uncharacterised protein [Mycobacteroides abscessus subsp. abscessus]